MIILLFLACFCSFVRFCVFFGVLLLLLFFFFFTCYLQIVSWSWPSLSLSSLSSVTLVRLYCSGAAVPAAARCLAIVVLSLPRFPLIGFQWFCGVTQDFVPRTNVNQYVNRHAYVHQKSLLFECLFCPRFLLPMMVCCYHVTCGAAVRFVLSCWFHFHRMSDLFLAFLLSWLCVSWL